MTSAGARLNTNTELRYLPYGAAAILRSIPKCSGVYTAGTTPTTFDFTGQRKDSGTPKRLIF